MMDNGTAQASVRQNPPPRCRKRPRQLGPITMVHFQSPGAKLRPAHPPRILGMFNILQVCRSRFTNATGKVYY